MVQIPNSGRREVKETVVSRTDELKCFIHSGGRHSVSVIDQVASTIDLSCFASISFPKLRRFMTIATQSHAAPSTLV